MRDLKAPLGSYDSITALTQRILLKYNADDRALTTSTKNVEASFLAIMKNMTVSWVMAFWKFLFKLSNYKEFCDYTKFG